MIFDLAGTPAQQQTIRDALARCDFPFDRLRDSLAREGKDRIRVDWEDLSRYGSTAAADDHGAHTIVREVEGRSRVLGLFYLPPHTRIVMHSTLAGSLAHEVFLAEAAHAIDYHHMTPAHRRAVWNALHADHQDVAEVIPESGDVDHGHSWFDGDAGYGSWVGEALMEGFVRAFAPTVPVTISLDHPVTPAAAQAIREALVPTTQPEPEPAPDDPVEGALAVALARFLRTRSVPDYLRIAAAAWLP